MSVDLVKLRRHFGKHEVPAQLAELFRLGAKGHFSSGDLELHDFEGEDVAQVHLGHLHGDAVKVLGDEVRAQLAFFARDADGSLYGLWFHDDRAVDEAPVVYVCSEGPGDAVLSNDLGEFLSLLRLDLEDVGLFFDLPREADQPPSKAHDKYLRWADKNAVPAAPTKPAAQVKQARAQHPDFGKWNRSLYTRCHALGEPVAPPTKKTTKKKPTTKKKLAPKKKPATKRAAQTRG